MTIGSNNSDISRILRNNQVLIDTQHSSPDSANIPRVQITNEARINTQHSSPVVTTQPRQMNVTSVSSGCEMLRTDCMNVLNSPRTCKVATGIIACGAMGGVFGAGVASLCGLNITKSMLIGYMAGTGTGPFYGCAVQKAHDIHWSPAVDESVAEAIVGMTIPSDAPTGNDADDIDSDMDDPQIDVSDSACLIPAEEKSAALKKNLELEKERFFE